MSEPNSTNTEHDPFSLDDEDATKGATDTTVDADASSDEDGEDEDDTDDDDGDDDADKADAEAARRAEKESADLRREDDKRRQADVERRRAASAPPAGRASSRASAPAPAEEPRPAKMLVRVKPHNPKKGQTMRTHSRIYDGARATFVEGKGWYDVSHALAEELRSVRCSDMDPDSNLAFDVCTPREARRVDEREEQALEQETRAPAKRPRSPVN